MLAHISLQVLTVLWHLIQFFIGLSLGLWGLRRLKEWESRKKF